MSAYEVQPIRNDYWHDYVVVNGDDRLCSCSGVDEAIFIASALNAHATLVAALELADETLMADGYDADSHTRTAIASALARYSTTEEQPPCA